MKFKLSNTNISIALGLVAVGVAVVFRLFSEADLWFQMFSAILGVIVSECVSSIVKMYSQCPNEHGRKVLQDKELLLKNLFRIVEIFRQELYPNQTDFNRENIAQAIKNFDYAHDYFMTSCQLKSAARQKSTGKQREQI